MLRPEKGHKLMLHVLHQLKPEGRSFRWLIVCSGREEYEASLRKQIESLGMNTTKAVQQNFGAWLRGWKLMLRLYVGQSAVAGVMVLSKVM